MDTPAYDQRLGKRRDLDVPIDAAWTVPRKARLRTHITDEPVRIVNVSPTGAGLVARPGPLFGTGFKTRLSLGEASCRIAIRRIEPGTDDHAYYGVRFVDPDPEFVDMVLHLAGAPPREQMESYWNSAQ